MTIIQKISQPVLDGKILIIDDEPSNVKLLEKFLRISGFTSLMGVTDSREAKKLYMEFKPDIVLLDLDMPYLDGFDVMKELQAVGGEYLLTVLVLTGRDDHQTCLNALQAGAQDFVTKPFEPLEIINRIRNILKVVLLNRQVRDHNRSLEENVRERTKELNDTRLEVINRLARASEYRDNETGGHIIRIGKMCEMLGKAIGLDYEKSELLLHSSPMHDVGKIGIPDKILLKAGKLDPEEWEVMKTHSSIGSELLSGPSSDLMVMARNIALTHHEKWDGSGYPAGLSGEEIPLEGRICAICDVFDALRSQRPYKKAWSTEESVKEIIRLKGKNFDPMLVDAFTDNFGNIVTMLDDLRTSG